MQLLHYCSQLVQWKLHGIYWFSLQPCSQAMPKNKTVTWLGPYKKPCPQIIKMRAYHSSSLLGPDSSEQLPLTPYTLQSSTPLGPDLHCTGRWPVSLQLWWCRPLYHRWGSQALHSHLICMYRRNNSLGCQAVCVTQVSYMDK